MDAHTINDQPFHEGGKYGAGQEMYYHMHRTRLWRWYCSATNNSFSIRDTSLIYKKKKEVLQGICQTLGLPTTGKNKELIARLDRYEFTPDQLHMLQQQSFIKKSNTSDFHSGSQ
jgi:hypothetical protein